MFLSAVSPLFRLLDPLCSGDYSACALALHTAHTEAITGFFWLVLKRLRRLVEIALELERTQQPLSQRLQREKL